MSVAPVLPSRVYFLSGATMSDHAKTDRPREGSAEERTQVNDTSKKESGHTQAGQEAAQGNLPDEHDREHQSGYGGGGPKGGTSA